MSWPLTLIVLKCVWFTLTADEIAADATTAGFAAAVSIIAPDKATMLATAAVRVFNFVFSSFLSAGWLFMITLRFFSFKSSVCLVDGVSIQINATLKNPSSIE